LDARHEEIIMAKAGPRFHHLVDEAKQKIRECDAAEVKAKLDRGESFHLVDVREESEWNRGHLPRAIHLGKGVLERDVEETIPDSGSEIVLYCGGGSRSALAAESLQRMGYTNVYSLKGGFSGWKNAGLPLEGTGG
jgi:rhodanese-related sulfurtransferase